MPNKVFFTSSGDYVGEENSSSDVSEKAKSRVFSLGSEKASIHAPKWSGHHLKWKFGMTGIPQRAPDKVVHMRNFTKRIWYYNKKKGITVVANLKTLEIWIKSRKYRHPNRLLQENWLAALSAAKEFAHWQQISLKPVWSEQPGNVKAAHMVIETKKLNPYLKPLAEQPGNKQVGLVFDESHGNKPEFTGPESADASLGADYLFTKFPGSQRELLRKVDGLEKEIKETKFLNETTNVILSRLTDVITDAVQRRKL